MRIAINGFGRIGRTFFRQAVDADDIEVVAVNDLGDIETLAYLLQYDTVYRRFEHTVETSSTQEPLGGVEAAGQLLIEGEPVHFLQVKDPANLPWSELEVDVVIESTGVFTSYEKSRPHLEAGAKRVVISAPADGTPTATPNISEHVMEDSGITSNASCTTNACTPVSAILGENPGIEKAMLTTVHAYTGSQNVVDGPNSKIRRGRAAAQNIVPSSTGSAEATARALPWLENKFDGIAMRVPVAAGSIIDYTFLAQRDTSVEEINDIFREAAGRKEWKDIIAVTDDPLVSSDILGQLYGAIVDTEMTRVVDGNLVKVLAWYDNEWGYCAMLLKHLRVVQSLL